MKKGLILTGVFIFMFSFGFSRAFDIFSVTAAESYQNISADEAIKVIGSEKDVLVLDVRTQEEYTGPLGHIPGAKLLPVQELASRINELASYKEKKVLVTCRSGVRSVQASRFLVQNGFNSVYNIETGMIGINKAGMKVEK